NKRRSHKKGEGDDDVGDEREPQAMSQHPERCKKECPKRKAVAYEHETFGIGRRIVRSQRRLVHGVNGHRLFLLTRRVSLWSRVLRWLHGDRSRAQCATPSPGL